MSLDMLPSGGTNVTASASEFHAPGGPLRLHLGCGTDYREGWVNVDGNPQVRADLYCSVESLPAIRDGSAQVVEACHVLEHLTLTQACAALREWRRVLRDGGELFLELPDLEACIRILGQASDPQGFDFGMIGLYGWPPDIDREGVPQMHKWGWTRAALAEELRQAGFGEVTFPEVTQTWRPATRLGRDVRVRAIRVATKAADPDDAAG
jgi:Methyltransferase domain